MTGRILRVELWRSNARWMALLLLPAVIGVGEAGRGLTVLALDQRQALFGAFPLAMGVAAWHARRDRRSGVEELLATMPRPRWQRVLPGAVALVIGAFAAFLLTCLVNVALVANAGGYLSTASLPIVAVGAVALLAPVAFGLAVGRWLPFMLVPPVLILYMAMNLFFGDTEAYTEGPDASGEPPGWLLLWGTLQSVGTEFDFAAITARTHLGQALWLVALAAAGIILYATTRPGGRAAAVAVVAVGAAVAVPVLPDRYAEAYALDPGATAPVCTPRPPRVCVTRAHRAALPDLSGPGREALAILAAKLPDPPTSVTEISYADPPAPRADTVHIALWVGGDGRLRGPVLGIVPDIRWELLLGAGTPSCADPPPGTPERRRYDLARLVAAAWLLDQDPPPADPGDPALASRTESLAAYQALRRLPPDQQRTRVAQLRRAELACDSGDRLDLLTGPR
ncbi:hypothetical protein RB614_27715 [Phytohabitans sp. ZYX-F-186]|uniref:ABC transporter permease n=1 Tax=Phytohabitans maris TaxID=3071409 RepID=A0ABU0ZMU3_9ACTN|nr:hypothetical protein [Phytohabitans sp. ZYX-F-186]MDQ7908320.1 hypothetical protein [Phytohabitans sp. ZYX-F-186]